MVMRCERCGAEADPGGGACGACGGDDWAARYARAQVRDAAETKALAERSRVVVAEEVSAQSDTLRAAKRARRRWIALVACLFVAVLVAAFAEQIEQALWPDPSHAE